MRPVAAGAVLGALILGSGCGGGADFRQEDVAKLRALGVAASPLVSAWSPEGGAPNEVELTVYAALPLGQQVTVAAFRDPRQKAPLTFAAEAIAVDQSTAQLQMVGGLQIFQAKAKVKIPTLAQAAAAHALRPGSTGAQLNYGFRLGAGAEEELVVGTFLAFAPGSPELAWQAPTAQITVPAAGAVLPQGVKGDLRSAVANTNAEDIKLGWFTTGGEIQNRRAHDTVWTHPTAGPQTLILTIHGKKSRGFSFQVIPVTTE